MCDLYPSVCVDVDTAVKHIKKYRKKAKPFSVYLQWAQEKLDELRSHRGSIGVQAAVKPFPPDPPTTNKGCAVLLLKSYESFRQDNPTSLHCIASEKETIRYVCLLKLVIEFGRMVQHPKLTSIVQQLDQLDDSHVVLWDLERTEG